MTRSRFRLLAPLAVLGLLAACQRLPQPQTPTSVEPSAAAGSSVEDRASSGVVEVTLLHLNDVYEIGAVEGGRRGGLARIATLRQQLLKENPNTLVVHAGDFLSPSAMGTAKVDGKRLDGRQMVSVLNALKLDLVTLGNHEFDVPEESFRDRLAESKFEWISANVTNRNGAPFSGIPPSKVYTFQGAGKPGEEPPSVRVAFVGVMLEEKGEYFRVGDPLAAVRRQADALKGDVDVLVGLTHLTLDQDAALTDAVPELAVILGGHEHDNYQVRRGRKGIAILKGDANARSVFIHRLTYDPATQDVNVTSQLLAVTEAIPEDPVVAQEVERWTQLAYTAFRASGLDPDKVVADVPVALDGKESSVRYRSTDLTDLIARGLKAEVPEATLAFYNAGSIRIDDEIPPGSISQYDVIRVLPFGGPVVGVRIRGSLLQQVLDQGVANRGGGGFLQTDGVLKSSLDGPWEIAGEPLQRDQVYVAAVGDFLLTGREKGFSYLTPDNEALEVIGDFRDVRLALIAEIARTYGP